MMKIECNIDKNDRINRTVFGLVLLLGGLIGLGKYFMMLIGVILIVEGLIGWCGIPTLIAKFRNISNQQ